MSLIQELKSRYPDKEFSQDPETGLITFTFEDMKIYDPWSSECGRFTQIPSYYGIETSDALRIAAVNLPIKDRDDEAY